MKGSRAAQRYAKAILSLAKDKNSADAVYSDMETISNTIAGSRDLKTMLGSPVVKANLKKNVLTEVFKDADAITLGAFDLLVQNERVDILDLVAKQYIAKYNEMNKIEEAVVTTAIPLDDALEAKVLAKVKELTGGKATIQNVIDESIIGGFVLRVGDMQYDASVKHNLDNLKEEFKNNTYVSKI